MASRLATDGADANTIYNKLTSLCSEMETEIKNSTKLSRSDVDGEIMKIRSESFSQQSPEAEYASRLFRYYSQDRSKNAESDLDNVNLGDNVPPVLYQGHPDQIVGLSALKKNIFWMRVVVLVFSFIGFVIMALVPDVYNKNPTAADITNVRHFLVCIR